MKLHFHAYVFIGQWLIKYIYNFTFIAYTMNEGRMMIERDTAAVMDEF
jgi:hypothetical protein